MKGLHIYVQNCLLTCFVVLLLGSCSTQEEAKSDDKHSHKNEKSFLEQEILISPKKMESIAIEVEQITPHTFQGIVHTNGHLRVPPQHEATVTAIIGGNVTNINVIEGSDVKKGQVLASIQHPELIQIQSSYLKAFHRDEFLAAAYKRQQKLVDADIGAGKKVQETKAEYFSNLSDLKGYEAQLEQLDINISRIEKGNLYKKIPIKSPINGSIEKVNLQIGQYVSPQKGLFKIVNTKHVHADFMIYERDVSKVQKGQHVSFTVENSDHPLEATIISVGQRFEEDPRAVHMHAEIKENDQHLIPGMYIKGKVFTKKIKVDAVPEEAIINEKGKQYVFMYTSKKKENVYRFRPLEVKTKMKENGWVEIQLLGNPQKNPVIVQKGAYYLIAEVNKSKTKHSH